MSRQKPGSLDPLLRPESLAFVGVSPRPGSPGNTMLRAAAVDGFGGPIFAINPRYDRIDGAPCYASLDDLPQRAEHVVLGLGNEKLEEGLLAAARHGAKAATIFASCDLTGQPGDGLAARLTTIAREAGMALCGGNSMGFCNPTIGLRVLGYASALPMRPGSIAFITQSGSAFSALAYNDERLKYSLAVSSGREMTSDAADYIDWALDQPQTRTIGLFLETARSPEKFVAALEKADRLGVPVVALKVGKSRIAAEFAVSHSGAITGNAAAWEALFDRHGVIAVDTLDQLAATLQLAAAVPLLPEGGLASLHDSGGEREMVADLAEDLRVPFAPISQATLDRLARNLDPGLHPANPLDVWGTGRDFEAQVEACMSAMLDDPATAIGVFFQDMRDDSPLADKFADAVIRAQRACGKPAAIVSNYATVSHRALALRVAEDGVPVIDGTQEGLIAIRQLMEHRDRQSRTSSYPDAVGEDIRRKWRNRLGDRRPLSPDEAMALLSDYGIGTARTLPASTEAEAVAAAGKLGYPVVLKSDAPGLHHKSDAGGVALNLGDETALRAAYGRMSAALGPRATVAPMVSGRVEIAFGLVQDPHFGPYVMVAAGGIFIEALADRAVALPPLAHETARDMIARLRIAKLMGAVRGLAAVDAEALAQALARFGTLAADLGDLIAELDINPLLVSQTGAVAVDALVVTQAERQEMENAR